MGLFHWCSTWTKNRWKLSNYHSYVTYVVNFVYEIGMNGANENANSCPHLLCMISVYSGLQCLAYVWGPFLPAWMLSSPAWCKSCLHGFFSLAVWMCVYGMMSDDVVCGAWRSFETLFLRLFIACMVINIFHNAIIYGVVRHVTITESQPSAILAQLIHIQQCISGFKIVFKQNVQESSRIKWVKSELLLTQESN